MSNDQNNTTTPRNREEYADHNDPEAANRQSEPSSGDGAPVDPPEPAQMLMQLMQRYEQELRQFAENQLYDILVYNGPISDYGYNSLWNALKSTATIGREDIRGSDDLRQAVSHPSTHRISLLLILISRGGDPDAAFKCARLLQNIYSDRFMVFVPSICESAGTLLCLGASKVFTTELTKLGPLDMQLPRLKNRLSGEIPWENRMSAAELRSAADMAGKMAIQFYNECANQTGDNSTAKELTVGLFREIFGNLDPEFMGVVQRKLNIARDYGHRLAEISENVFPGGVEKLIYGYADHGAIIDYHEARNVFRQIAHVGQQDDAVQTLCATIEMFLRGCHGFAVREDGIPYVGRLTPSLIGEG